VGARFLFCNPQLGDERQKIALIRSIEEETQSQLKRLRDFKVRRKDEPGPVPARLQQAVIDNQNVFEVLVDAVRCCSLGQITNALFEVGGSIAGVCSRTVLPQDSSTS
jgi:methylmalonyl-CoA mutase